MTHTVLLAGLLVATMSSVVPAAVAGPATQPTSAEYGRLAGEVELNLRTQILGRWFPAALDPAGGFHQNYDRQWKLLSDPARGIVYQSRLTWTAAQAMSRYPDQSAAFAEQTRHGLQFLSDKLWDAAGGGFFWSVTPDGKPIGQAGAMKLGYGNAFGIYAAAGNYQATHDSAALDLAQRAFAWYDAHAHDAAHGGYFEVASASSPQLPPDAPSPIGARLNQKSMNTSIHLLEALTALHHIWPDPKVRSRLDEMFHVVRDRIYTEPGHLVMYFGPDWQPQSTEDSYGHDVETAYLLVEAAEELGIPDDPATWHAARSLVDHALQVAVNPAGGLYDSGGVDGGDYAPAREWWTQAEWLNALLLMHDRFGRETPTYWNAFVAQWNWIQRYQVDSESGGWYAHVTNDNGPVSGDKSNQWTECYHQGRALLNVWARLRKLGDAAR